MQSVGWIRLGEDGTAGVENRSWSSACTCKSTHCRAAGVAGIIQRMMHADPSRMRNEKLQQSAS